MQLLLELIESRKNMIAADWFNTFVSLTDGTSTDIFFFSLKKREKHLFEEYYHSNHHITMAFDSIASDRPTALPIAYSVPSQCIQLLMHV
jgi:hypothetical protein